jgi:hypothetical protein
MMKLMVVWIFFFFEKIFCHFFFKICITVICKILKWKFKLEESKKKFLKLEKVIKSTSSIFIRRLAKLLHPLQFLSWTFQSENFITEGKFQRKNPRTKLISSYKFKLNSNISTSKDDVICSPWEKRRKIPISN